MVTNEKIWSALDRLAMQHGLTCGGLARAAELDQTIFNPSKRIVKATGKPRWPSSETIAKVLNVTGLTMAQFGEMVDRAGTHDGATDDDGAAKPRIQPRPGH